MLSLQFVVQAAAHCTTHCCCSVLHISNKCLEEDVPVFKYSIQDIVDELEVPPDDCKLCCKACFAHSVRHSTSQKHHHWAALAGNEEDMQAHQPQGPGLTITVHLDQMQPTSPIRYQPLAAMPGMPLHRHCCAG